MWNIIWNTRDQATHVALSARPQRSPGQKSRSANDGKVWGRKCACVCHAWNITFFSGGGSKRRTGKYLRALAVITLCILTFVHWVSLLTQWTNVRSGSLVVSLKIKFTIESNHFKCKKCCISYLGATSCMPPFYDIKAHIRIFSFTVLDTEAEFFFMLLT